jgi:hypothetical protein
VNPSTSPSRTKVCALCAASLDGLRPDARFCSPACRVEAGRIRAILSPSNHEAWASLRSRLEAAQKASEGLLAGGGQTLSKAGPPSEPQTAIGRLLSGIFGGRQLRKPKAPRVAASEQLSLFV